MEMQIETPWLNWKCFGKEYDRKDPCCAGGEGIYPCPRIKECQDAMKERKENG